MLVEFLADQYNRFGLLCSNPVLAVHAQECPWRCSYLCFPQASEQYLVGFPEVQVYPSHHRYFWQVKLSWNCWLEFL